MQDGPFIPSPTIGQPSIANSIAGRSPEYNSTEPASFIPAYSPGPNLLNNNPELYDNIKIANQSGLTNWWNKLIESWNDTQIGVGAADLMDGLTKKARTQQTLGQLEADHSLGKIGEMDYLNKKNKLYDDLSNAYNVIGKARQSIYNDEQDKNPISKAFNYKANLSNLQGGDASFIDQIKYQLPTNIGSSFSLMGQGIMASFGEKLIQTVVTRAAAGSAIPGLGTTLGLVSGLATTLATNLFTRNLESKAEVGSQFLQDYDNLKADLLRDKPQGYELSEQEDNELVLKASAGSDTQFRKNMSLALSDTLQSLILAGSFGKMLGKFKDLNKLTRLTTMAAGFYATKKLEGLEEGLQYAFQNEKSLASLGLNNTSSFFSSLVNDYRDVVSSMDFLGVKGKGPYSDDPQFTSSVHAGEMLGGFFGAVHAGVNIGKDIQAYRSVTKELAGLNPTKVEQPVLKFKDDLYAEFFGPKKVGVLGVLSQDSDDRVFYFKEALKTLNKQKTQEGQPLLDNDELKTELKNIDVAYSTFKEVNSTLDNILSPYGREISRKTNQQKQTFRDELFHNTMSLVRLSSDVQIKQNKAETKLSTLDDISQISAKLSIVNERLPNAVGNVQKYLAKEKKELESNLTSIKETADALKEKVPAPSPIDQSTAEALNHYYDAAESQFDYQEKRKTLSKVKTWSDLQKWDRDYEKRAPESYFKEREEALVQDNRDFAQGLGERKEFSTLTEEDKNKRTKDNRDILSRTGFTKSYMDTLSEDDLDKQAQARLKELKEGILTINEETILRFIIDSEGKDELSTYLNRPSIRAAFNRTGFDLNENYELLRARATERLNEIQKENIKNKIRKPRPGSLGENTRASKISSRTKDKRDTRESVDYHDQFNIKTSGEETYSDQKDVLEGIISSPYALPSDKELARKLLAVTKSDRIIFRENWREQSTDASRVFDSEGKPVNDDYNGLIRRPGTTQIMPDGTVRIFIDLGHFGDEIKGNQAEQLAPSFEATVLHELIHKYTAEAIDKNPDLTKQIQDIIDKAKGEAKNDYYGLNNPHEFLAEAMTSPDFQRFLAGIEGSGNKTLWQRFIEAVADILKRAFGLEIRDTLLEDAIALTTGVIDQNKPFKVSTVNFVDAINKEIDSNLESIVVQSKDAKAELRNTYNKLMDRITTAVNDNKLGDTVRNDLISNLTNKALVVENAIDKAREDAVTIYFQGVKFEKGKYVVISGYKEPYRVSAANDISLEVKSADGTVTTQITSVSTILFQGTESEARYYIDSLTQPTQEYIPVEFYKSTQQEFEPKSGQYSENVDPVVTRFQNFITSIVGSNFDKLPYKGLLVQDDDTVAGFEIPRTTATIEYHRNGGKRGQVVVIVDNTGNPITFSGGYVAFNIEQPKSILGRSTAKIASDRNITHKQALDLQKQVAEKIRKARESAASGKSVFLDITGAIPGIQALDAIKEVPTKPINEIDANRIIDLVNYLSGLDPMFKEKRQQIKDFLFYYMRGKTDGSKISGGEVFIANDKVIRPTIQDIIDNFDYNKSFKDIKSNNPYDVLNIFADEVVVEKTYPSYADYLTTVAAITGPITKDRYNGYLTYEIGKVKTQTDTATQLVKLDEIKPKDIFEGGALFDSSIDETAKVPEFTNELGLFDNKTTLDLVKSLDKGIHNYLRMTQSTTIVGALEDQDFLNKALDETRKNIIARLQILRKDREAKFASKSINEAWYNSQIKSIDDKVQKLENQWSKIANYYFKNSYVFSYSKDLSYQYDEEGNLVQEGDDRDAAKLGGFDTIGNEVSPIDGASKEVKALIRGLSRFKKVEDKYVKVGNSFNVPDLVNFAVTWNNLLKNLQGLATFEEMMNKIASLQTRFPEYTELVEILRSYYTKAQTGDVQALIMAAKFNRDFINPEVPVIQNLLSLEGGAIFKVDEATRKNVKDLRKQALDNFRYKSPYAVTTNLGDRALNPTILNLPTATREERVKFLEGLGFEFTKQTIQDPMFDVVASQQIIRYIKEDISLIQASRIIKDPLGDLSRQTAITKGQTKRINDILDLESKYSEKSPTLSMQNVEGNTEYAISRPNNYSTVIKAINDITKYPTFQSLVSEPQYSYLNKSYARTSHILNNIFILDSNSGFGNRRVVNGKHITLELTNISGLKIEESEGKKTTSMFIGDKIVSDFNQLLKSGFKEFMRAGDKNSSFGLRVSTYIQSKGTGVLPISDLAQFTGPNGYGGLQFSNILQNYLKGELIRMIMGHQGDLNNLRKMIDNNPKKNLADKPSLFFSLLTDEMKAELKDIIDKLPRLEPNSEDLYKQADVISNDFTARPAFMNHVRRFFYGEVKAKKEALEKYGFNFSDRYWLDKSLANVDEGTLLRSYIVNEFIIHVEQTKLFTGDIVFYSTKDGEAHKRFPAFGATGVIPITDNWFVEGLNRNPNTNLQAKNLGLNNQYSNVLKTVVFDEHVPASVYIESWTDELTKRGLSKEDIDRIIEPYKKNKEADAQGWITVDYYRSFKISIGDWRIQQEKVYQKISEGQALSVDEVENLNRLLPPVKAQYAGPVSFNNYHVPAFHKFSLMPLLPSVIKGTALESLNERMIRNNVSYALMDSGSKVGTIGNKLEKFYNNESSRTMKDPTTEFTNENLVFTHYLKEQVQIEPELHEEVIFGTQFRKLLFQNVYSNKIGSSKKLVDLEREYSDIISEITDYEKDRLIQDMGIIPVVNDEGDLDYEVKDQEKLLNRIKQEIVRRKLNNSIKNFFELQDGKLKYPLDASINHQQVRTLILSMINNRLIRQTIKGDMLIQGSSIGFEKLQKPTDVDLLKYGTNGLRFYHVADGKVRKMQVKTSFTGDFKHLLKFDWSGEKIKTLDRLNQALKDEKWMEQNSKSVTMIGYRIPTQGLNSMEVMEIAGFLPPESGNILIVPTEIVSKAGSDFDIDKLSVFKPSLYSRGKDGYYVSRTEYTGTKKDVIKYIQETIKPQLDSLISQKKSVQFYDSLSNERKNEFIKKLEQELGLSNAGELGQLGVSIQNLREQIQESQSYIDDLNSELRASLDPDKYEEMIAERARQMDLKIYLADELDKKEALKNTMLKGQDVPGNADRLLDALYDVLVSDITQYNDKINNQIKELVEDRRARLDQVANYKGGLFNRLIEVATERLLDFDSFPEFITPNSTDLIKPKVQEIASKSDIAKKPYLHTNNLTSSTQEEKFLAGIPNKQALGIAAVANTVSQLFAESGQAINEFFKGRDVFHPMVEDLNMSDKYLKGGILKSEIESQMINAYVDVLNDDFISKANLSLDTAGTFFYLLHLSHNPYQLMDFFNHPVIKKYIAEVQINKSIIKQQNDYNSAVSNNVVAEQAGDAPIEDLDSYLSNKAKREAFLKTIGANDYRTLSQIKIDGVGLAKQMREIFSAERLSDAVSMKLSDIPEVERRAILSYYLNVMEESSELLKLQQANNYDTTTSVNPIANDLREELKKDLDNNGLFKTNDITTPTVIKPFNQFALTSEVVTSLMPVTLNASIRAQIVDFVKEIRSIDQDKLSRTFINDWIQFLAFNLGETETGANFGQYGKNLLFKGSTDERLVGKLLEFKLNAKWNNLRVDFPVINSLRPDIDGPIGNVSLYREDNSSEYQNSIIEQFQNLVEFNDPTYSDEDQKAIRDFFKDLMILGFVQSGLNKSPISFSDLIPNDYYAPMMTKALDKYKELNKVQKDQLFYKFSSKFRDINTNLMGGRSNAVPYWRFKDYNLPNSNSVIESKVNSKDSFDSAIDLPNGTYESLIKTLIDNDIIRKECK